VSLSLTCRDLHDTGELRDFLGCSFEVERVHDLGESQLKTQQINENDGSTVEQREEEEEEEAEEEACNETTSSHARLCFSISLLSRRCTVVVQPCSVHRLCT